MIMLFQQFLIDTQQVVKFACDAAPDLGSGNSYGVWKIDDTDNSFSTQPFKIKYARQDILLSIMISFNFPLVKYEVRISLYSQLLDTNTDTLVKQKCSWVLDLNYILTRNSNARVINSMLYNSRSTSLFFCGQKRTYLI